MYRKLHILTLAAVLLLLTVAASTATAGTVVSQDRPDIAFAKVKTHHVQPLGIRYTKQHPVVFVADRRMYPFSFFNDKATPDGFSVGLIMGIFSNLHIPYEIRLVSSGEAVRQMLSGEAQLMISTRNPAPGRLYEGNVTLARQRLAVARLYTSRQKTMMELFNERDTILIPRGGYAQKTLEAMYPDTLKRYFAIKSDALSSAPQCIVNEECQYAIGSRPYLMHNVRYLALEDVIAIDDINLPEGSYRFISNDRQLVEEMERQFMRIKTSDSYTALVDRWLSDTGQYDKPVNMAYTIAIAILIVLVLVVIFVTLTSQKGKDFDELKKEFQTIAAAAQQMSGIQVMVSDMNKRWIRNVIGDMLPPNGLSIGGFEAYIHPEDITKVYQLRLAIDNGEDETEEPIALRMRKYSDPNGKWRNVTISTSVKRHLNNSVDKVYLAVKDDTDVIAARRRNMLQRSSINQFTNLTKVVIAYFDRDGQCIFANNAFRRLLASGGQDDVQWFIDRMTLSDICNHLGGIQATPDESLWFCSQLKIIELALNIHVEVRISPVTTGTGEMMGYTLTMSNLKTRRQDIAALALHRRRLERLEKERDKYLTEAQMIMRNNKMRVIRWDKGTDLIDSSGDLINKQRFSALSLVKSICDMPKDDLQKYIDNPRKYFDNPHELVHCYKWTTGARRTEYQWMHIIPRPRYGADGTPVGYEAIIIDESQKYDTQKELEKQLTAVKQLAQDKANFLANMTHELRTPLNIINGFAEVMPFTSDGAERKLYADVMAHNTAMLMHISKNILNLSIVDATGVPLRQRVVDFAAYFAANAMQMKKFIAPNTDVKLQVDTPLQHLYMLLDPERLFDILEIFITNASKNTTSGRIRIGYRYSDGHLLVYCTDTGKGIPYGSRENLFKRFYKVDDFVLGVGLGLPLAQAIADTMAGSIRYFSRPGKGSIFLLVLQRPLASEKDVAATPPPSSSRRHNEE